MINTMNFFELQRQSVNSGTIRIGGNCSQESRRTVGGGKGGGMGAGP